jgi:hypothetical protein
MAKKILSRRPLKREELPELKGTAVESLAIRQLRRKECFDIADRAAWYDALTQEQKAEVQSWRKAWLDAPETGIIPEKPDWIK